MRTLQELFAQDGIWTQGAYARNEKGDRRMPFQGDACQFCLLGAVNFVYYSDKKKCLQAQDRLTEMIQKDDEAFVSIQDWNDDPKRTIEEVRALVKEAGV